MKFSDYIYRNEKAERRKKIVLVLAPIAIITLLFSIITWVANNTKIETYKTTGIITEKEYKTWYSTSYIQTGKTRIPVIIPHHDYNVTVQLSDGTTFVKDDKNLFNDKNIKDEVQVEVDIYYFKDSYWYTNYKVVYQWN